MPSPKSTWASPGGESRSTSPYRCTLLDIPAKLEKIGTDVPIFRSSQECTNVRRRFRLPRHAPRAAVSECRQHRWAKDADDSVNTWDNVEAELPEQLSDGDQEGPAADDGESPERLHEPEHWPLPAPEAAGIEPLASSAGNNVLRSQRGAESGALGAWAASDSILAAVVDAWPSLSEGIKAGILAIVRASL